MGVVDTGIDPAHPEFQHNLSPLSTDVVAGRASQIPASLHGTEVSGLIAAEKNDVGIQGVAFDATLLMVRADTEGSCHPSCSFSTDNIAKAINYAVDNGARIINFSQTGSSAPTGSLLAALQRAANAGVIMVFAAGNDGGPSPDASTSFANQVGAQGLGIIAGASTVGNGIASFSNRAGTSENVYVLAPGDGVKTTGAGTSIETVRGTSFSAPMVAGAAALLLQQFPNLSGADVLRILRDTATDKGVPGVDSVYGAGIINLTAALAPQGAASLPTDSGSAGLSGSTLSMGSAFGDAVTSDASAASLLERGIIIDKYDRTYRANLTTRVATMPDGRFDLASIARESVYRRGTSGFVPGVGAFQMSFTDEWGVLDERKLFPNFNQDRTFQDLSFSFVHALDARTSVSVSHGTGFVGQFDEVPEADMLRSYEGGGPFMRFTQGGTGLAMRRLLDPRTTVGFAASSGELTPFDGGKPIKRDLAIMQVDRAVGRSLTLGGQFGVLREDGSLLDTVATGAFDGIKGATTRFASLTAAYRLGHWTLVASATHGWTSVSEHGDALLHSYSGIQTSAYSFGAVWQTPLAGHTLGFAVSQPLRVESGRATLDVPTGRNFAANTVLFDSQNLNLAPSGREIDLELSHSFWIGGPLYTRTNLVYRMNPDHVASAADELMLMVQADLRF